MLPGPMIIKECSKCSNLIADCTIASGNTFGAEFWTDGKREAPMLPEQPWLVICPHCGSAVWIDDLEEIGRLELWKDVQENFDKAAPCKSPTVEEYFRLLKKGRRLGIKSATYAFVPGGRATTAGAGEVLKFLFRNAKYRI